MRSELIVTLSSAALALTLGACSSPAPSTFSSGSSTANQEPPAASTKTTSSSDSQKTSGETSAPDSSRSADDTTTTTSTSASGKLYDIDKVDPDVKAYCEAYSEFTDEYIAFMEKCKEASSSDQVAMMGDYNALMQQELEMAEKAKGLEKSKGDWNIDTQQYWVDTYTTVSQKLLAAS